MLQTARALLVAFELILSISLHTRDRHVRVYEEWEGNFHVLKQLSDSFPENGSV